MFFQHLSKVAVHAQFGHIPVVQGQADGAVVVGIHEEVGHYLLHVFADGFSHRGARARVQPADFADGLFAQVFADAELLLYLVPMFAGEFFVAVRHDGFFCL